MKKTKSIKPTCNLSGQDGNVFNLIGLASRALKKCGQDEVAAKMSSECFSAGSYDEAIIIIMKYVDVK